MKFSIIIFTALLFSFNLFADGKENSPNKLIKYSKLRLGKLELRFDQEEVYKDEIFTIYLENKSNKSATINKASINLLGFSSDKPFLGQPDISVVAFGSCPVKFHPGKSCFIKIKNDKFLAPPKNKMATVYAVIDVKYEDEIKIFKLLK